MSGAYHILPLVGGTVELLVGVRIIMAGELGTIRLLTPPIDNIHHTCTGPGGFRPASLPILIPKIPPENPVSLSGDQKSLAV
jgi:hypothetical protein